MAQHTRPRLDVGCPLEHVDGTPLIYAFTDTAGDHYLRRADGEHFARSQYPGALDSLIVVDPSGCFWMDGETILARNIPGLLAAAEALVARWPTDQHDGSPLKDEIEALRAAIAKARGEA
jgi:hypothetical protein